MVPLVGGADDFADGEAEDDPDELEVAVVLMDAVLVAEIVSGDFSVADGAGGTSEVDPTAGIGIEVP